MVVGIPGVTRALVITLHKWLGTKRKLYHLAAIVKILDGGIS